MTLNTGITIEENDRIDLYTNQDGNHILIHKANQLYYYLYTYNGLHVRHTVVDNFTESPKLSRVTGWEDKVYVIYKKGSLIYTKRSEDAGQSWTDITPRAMTYPVSNGLEVISDEVGVHMAWSEQYGAPYYYETNYSKLWHEDGFWSDFKQVTDETGEDGDLPSITTSPNRVYISYSGGTFNTMKLRIKDGSTWQPREEISPYWPPYLMGLPVHTYQNNVIADQDNLNVFYYGILDTPVKGEGSYLQYINRDNSLNNGPWFFDENYYHATYTNEEVRIDITLTPNNHLHSVHNGNVYEEHNNGTFNHYASSVFFGKPHRIDANNNDVYLAWIWHENFVYNIYLRQRDYAPLAPQNLTGSWNNNHPHISWDANSEADLEDYDVWKKIDSGSWSLKTTTTNTYYTDFSEEKYSIGQDKMYVYYKINAVDYTNNESGFTSSERFAVNAPQQSPRWSWNTSLTVEPVIPIDYQLKQNFPNPFNPETNITFGIPEDNFVNIVIYSIKGEKITTLVNEQLPAGSYTAQFDGSALPSGVYIYRINAGSFTQIKRMLLIK